MDTPFSRVAGLCGMVAGLCGLLYLVAFLVLRDPSATVPSLILLIAGILETALLVGLYQRALAVDAGLALWGWLLAVAGAGGAAVHAGFDLSNNLHPPAMAYAYPSAIDPRGLLTFGFAGLGTIVLSRLLLRGAIFSRGVAMLGIVSGVLLIALYVVYLVLLDPGNPLLVALIFATGILQPVWNLWIGQLLWRESAVR